MHQSEQFFAATDTSNLISILFSSVWDYHKYVTFTMPFNQAVDLNVLRDFFAVIWPACKDMRIFIQKYCADESDWRDYCCLQCDYNEIITLVPDTKFKILLEYTELSANESQEDPGQNSSPASCRMMYIHKEYLESQQRKLYSVEFTIPQHVTKPEQTMISELSVIEKEERLLAPGYSDVITNLLETCTVKLLRIYSRQFLKHESPGDQPASNTLAGRLPELLDYIRVHWHEDISVTRLAEKFNVHRCSLSKCFKKHYNRTLQDYLQELRLERITAMLTVEGIPIRSISELLGYKSVRGFSKFFRLKKGSTPAQYRRSILKQKALSKTLDNM